MTSSLKNNDYPSVLQFLLENDLLFLPPYVFGLVEPVIMALRDEIASLKAGVSEHRTATQRHVRSMEQFMTIKEDVADIKKFTHELRSHKEDSSHIFAGMISEPVPNRSNEHRNIPESIKPV